MAQTSENAADRDESPESDERPLFMLAFDHRKSIRPLFGIAGEPTAADRERIADVKLLIFESLLASLDRLPAGARAGLLTDEETGAGVLRRAGHADVVASVAVERSGQKEFRFEYGDDFKAHIEEFRPEFVKALVRYNPGGDRDLNRRQAERLKVLSDWLDTTGSELLFELLVPAEPDQLAAVSQDPARYDRELRPGLVCAAVAELQGAGVQSRTWKIEGLDDTADCERVAATVREGDPGANCLILGRGADEAKVEHWLRTAAPVPGFDGFAVGRTIWWDTIARHLAGEIGRDQATEVISGRYLHFVERYVTASAGGV